MKTILIISFSCFALHVFASPETHTAKAEEVYRLSDGGNTAKYLDGKINDLARKMVRSGMPKECSKEITEAVRSYVLKRVDPKKIDEKAVNRLVKDFTEEELVEAIQMLKSPVFQKLKNEGPLLKKDMDNESEKALQGDVDELKEQIIAIAKKYKH